MFRALALVFTLWSASDHSFSRNVSSPAPLPLSLTLPAPLQSQGLPLGHILLDSWWYGERIFAGGVSEWEDSPALMAKTGTFPSGLAAFHAGLGANVSLWAHNSAFIASSPYTQRFPFAGRMPQGRTMWDHLFALGTSGWALAAMKQDHVGDTLAAAGTIRNTSQVAAWWGGMSDAGVSQGVAIQLCCSPPMVLLNSLNMAAANGARSSPDYVARAPGRPLLDYPRWQWANGVESAFHYAIGLMPEKDGFFTNSSQKQHGGDGLDSSLWPAFYNWTVSSCVWWGDDGCVDAWLKYTSVGRVQRLMRAL